MAIGSSSHASANGFGYSPGAGMIGRIGSANWRKRSALFLGLAHWTIDGEACVCGSDGVPVFAMLHSGSYDSAVVLYAFDLLELNGTDLRTERWKGVRLGWQTWWKRRIRAALAIRTTLTKMAQRFSVTPASSVMRALSASAGISATDPAGVRAG